MSLLKIARVNTWISYSLLIVFMWVDLFINPPQVAFISLLAIILIKTVPLLLPIVGIIRGNLKAHAWLCFIVLIYFINGVLRATMPNDLAWGLIEIFLSLDVFISAMLFIRAHKKIAVNLPTLP